MSHSNSDSEITSAEKMDDNKAKPITTDKIQQSRAPKGYFGARRRYSTLNCSINKKKLNESNKDLDNKVYRIPDALFTKLQQNGLNYKGDGSQRLQNIINMRDIKTGEMYRLLNNMKNIDKNSQEYNALGGNEMYRWLEKELNTAKNLSHNNKVVKRAMGDTNAFIKKHIKNKNEGAHSSKKNGTTFDYEN